MDVRLWLCLVFLFQALPVWTSEPIDEEDGYYVREYSLLKPFSTVGQSWDIVGSTVVTSTFIRLTADRQSQTGGIWSNMPVRMHNWEAVLHFNVHGSGDLLFGDGMAFWYTRDRLRRGNVFGSTDYFTGLGIFLDTYSNHNGPHEHEHPYISAMINNGTLSYDHDRDGTHSQVAGCHSKFRKRKHDTYVIISYIDQVLSVHTNVDGTDDWIECFTAENIDLPTGYYFGLTAATGELADNHDVVALRTFDVDSEVQEAMKDWDNVVPQAPGAEAPRRHIDDPKQVVGTRGWFILKVLTVILVLVAVVGGVIYIVYSRKQQQAKKRFY